MRLPTISASDKRAWGYTLILISLMGFSLCMGNRAHAQTKSNIDRTATPIGTAQSNSAFTGAINCRFDATPVAAADGTVNAIRCAANDGSIAIGNIAGDTLDTNVAEWNGVAPTAATALADNFANPTPPPVGSFGMLWDGGTWDRWPGTNLLGGGINVMAYGGTATTLGAKAAAISIPVVLASDQAKSTVIDSLVVGSGAGADSDLSGVVVSAIFVTCGAAACGLTLRAVWDGDCDAGNAGQSTRLIMGAGLGLSTQWTPAEAWSNSTICVDANADANVASFNIVRR